LAIQVGMKLPTSSSRLLLPVASLIVRLLPESLVHVVAEVLGTLWFSILRYRRTVILENLAQAFPENGDRERRALGRSACIHLARALIEFIKIPLYLRSGFDGVVRIEGMEHYEAAKNKGKGVLVVSGHLGSFGVALAAAAQKFRTVSVLVKRLPHTLGRFVNTIRMSTDLQVIPAHGAMQLVLKALKNNRTVVVVLDQNSTRRKGVFVDFFKKPACTMAGLAVLALRTGAPVIGASVWRERTGIHVIRFHAEFPLDRKASPNETVQQLTQLYTSFIEQAIRNYPEQWLWPHNRWRTEPPKN
jgi:KDO2-lipid IV(A) lauroyltransferase